MTQKPETFGTTQESWRGYLITLGDLIVGVLVHHPLQDLGRPQHLLVHLVMCEVLKKVEEEE